MSVNNAYENEEQSTSFYEPEVKTSSPPPSYEGEDKNSDSVTIPVAGALVDDVIPKPYAGMPKEVLLHYSRQKKYLWARNILTGLVVLTILTLLSLVIALIAISPACQEFWQTSPIYQVYPKSFLDTDNDGIGDLNGIEQKLDYLSVDLGVQSVWLNPVYKSPQSDNGYDVQDYLQIDPIFGTMADMDNLITSMHDKGMAIIMDFIPNHTSDKHEWFEASSDPSHVNHNFYRDYYVWVDGNESIPPNNWQSVFGGSAWTWHATRKKYYYHAFLKTQPDLNCRNEQVLIELDNILRFWLNKGVDGFRADAVKFLIEEEHLRNNPLKDDTKPESYDNMYADYTENLGLIHDIIPRWREVLKAYSTEPGVYKFMTTEVYDDIDNIMRYYGNSFVYEADFPGNFGLIEVNDWTAENVYKSVMEWMENMPSGRWPNWVLGNHDNSRLATRLGRDEMVGSSFLTLTLSGTPGIYYGEEIGMEDTVFTNPDDFRDGVRTPMQWNLGENAGFCTNCTPWLQVNDNYLTSNINVESMLSDQSSLLRIYKRLIALRNDHAFARGWLCMINQTSDTIIYIREISGADSKMVIINFGSAETINLRADYPILPTSGVTIVSSEFSKDGTVVNFGAISLTANEAMVVNFKPGGNMFSKLTPLQNMCFNPQKICVNALGLLQVC